MGPAAKLPPCTTRLRNGEDRHPIDKNRNPNISTGFIVYHCRQWITRAKSDAKVRVNLTNLTNLTVG